MYRVPAGHFVGGRAGGEQVFLTDGTIRHVFSYFAIVVVEEVNVNAHSAVVAVAKVLLPADAAKSTIRAMVRIFFVGHPEVAYGAMVRGKLNSTGSAFVGFTRLPQVTLPTDNFPNGVSINSMMLRLLPIRKRSGQTRTPREFFLRRASILTLNTILRRRQNRTFVVTNSTTKNGCTARRDNRTISFVMRTLRTRFLHPERDFVGVHLLALIIVCDPARTAAESGVLWCDASGGVAATVHEELNGATTFHLWYRLIGHDCLDAGTTFMFLHCVPVGIVKAIGVIARLGVGVRGFVCVHCWSF